MSAVADWDRAEALFRAADEEKAVQILLLDLRPLTVLCDYFLICHGNSITHVGAIGEGIVQRLKEQGVGALSVEQPRDPKWVALDYGDVVVHIFTEAARRFYNLEGLWGEAQVVRATADPHPNPLPEGEGFSARSPAVAGGLPLPSGEGQGEGCQ